MKDTTFGELYCDLILTLFHNLNYTSLALSNQNNTQMLYDIDSVPFGLQYFRNVGNAPHQQHGFLLEEVVRIYSPVIQGRSTIISPINRLLQLLVVSLGNS